MVKGLKVVEIKHDNPLICRMSKDITTGTVKPLP